MNPRWYRIAQRAVSFCCVLLFMAMQGNTSPTSYLGFDANEYPGDAALASLRRAFAFSGYWLNIPPGADANEWVGKRSALLKNGFGFLVLFNGQTISQLKTRGSAAEAGKVEGQSAVALAQQEGFHSGTVIFLDQEGGGRMTDEQNAYIFAWFDAVIAGGFHAGIYCSGMPAKEGRGQTILTADDIRAHAGARKILFFVYNDACPPSPGCVYPKSPPPPSASGVPYASVWQFAQSPRRHEFTKRCADTYNSDGYCYAPGAGPGSVNLDLNSSLTPDPSNGRK
jgi:hypothetical protein